MAWYDEVHTAKKFRLGTKKRNLLGQEFIYLQGVGSTVANDAVTYDEDGATIRLLTSTPAGPVAIAMAAVDATTEYGFYGIWGEFTVSAGDVADNGAVYATATAGKLDDAELNLSHIYGATFRSTDNSTAVTATIQIQYPYHGPEDLSA